MPDRAEFDYAIVGAGLSGLLLARALLASASPASRTAVRILIADPTVVDDARATFAFWARSATELDPWTIGEWDTWTVIAGSGRRTTIPLGGWTYRAVSWDRARVDLLEELVTDPRVVLVPEAVTSISDGADLVRISIGSTVITAAWVFDSRPPGIGSFKEQRPRRARHEVELAQSFHGVWVETRDNIFDTDSATVMDFTSDSGPRLGFSYVLPTGPTTAMVMAVHMATEPSRPDPEPVVARLVGTQLLRSTGVERGVSVLVSPPRPRRQGQRILDIGCRAGLARPSTGYAATRIMRDTHAIAASLARRGDPFALPAEPSWRVGLDTLWMRALVYEGQGLESAFMALFDKVPIDTVLRFLDGEVGRREAAGIALSLPPAPFLRTMMRRQ